MFHILRVHFISNSRSAESSSVNRKVRGPARRYTFSVSRRIQAWKGRVKRLDGIEKYKA